MGRDFLGKETSVWCREVVLSRVGRVEMGIFCGLILLRYVCRSGDFPFQSCASVHRVLLGKVISDACMGGAFSPRILFGSCDFVC